jgi:hypothetical protein
MLPSNERKRNIKLENQRLKMSVFSRSKLTPFKFLKYKKKEYKE